MSKKTVLSRKERIREMTILAMFIAIITVMTFVPQLGFIMLFQVSITLIHIPVLIGAVLLGRKSGMILGLTFGVASMIRGAMSGGLDFLFIFPWVSIVPRFIFGWIIYDVYQLFKKVIKNRLAALAVSFLILSLLHSLMVLPMLLTAFPLAMHSPSVSNLVGGDGMNFINSNSSLALGLKLIWSVLITNSIIEALLAAIVGSVVADRLMAYLSYNKKLNRGIESN